MLLTSFRSRKGINGTLYIAGRVNDIAEMDYRDSWFEIFDDSAEKFYGKTYAEALREGAKSGVYDAIKQETVL